MYAQFAVIYGAFYRREGVHMAGGEINLGAGVQPWPMNARMAYMPQIRGSRLFVRDLDSHDGGANKNVANLI
jgi:hypothetical protein